MIVSRRFLAATLGGIVVGSGVGLATVKFSASSKFSANSATRSGEAGSVESAVIDTLGRLRSGEALTPSDFASLQNEIDAWLLRDPVGCINRLKRLDALGFVTSKQLDSAADLLAGSDFAIGLKLGKEIDDRHLAAAFLRRAFSSHVARDPESVYLLVPYIPKAGHLQDELSAVAIKAWLQKDSLKEVTVMLKDLPKSADKAEWSFELLAAKDPVTALRCYLETKDLAGESERNIRDTVIEAARTKDPMGSLEVIEKLPDSRQKAKLLESVFGALAAKSPEAVIGRLSQQGPTSLGAIKTVTENLDAIMSGIKDPNKFADFVDAIPNENIREQALAAMAFKTAYTDFAKGAYWADHLKDAGDRKIAIEMMTKSRPSEKSMEFMLSLPEGDSRTDFVHFTLNGIRSRIPNTGEPNIKSDELDWINSLSPRTKQALANEIGATATSDKLKKLLPFLQ